MYKRLGISNADAAFYTGWLYLPWVIKPLWSPFVDLIKTKRWWIVSMQLLIGAGLAGVAFCIPLPYFLQTTLAILWLIAFSSATHDIAADGFYMIGLSQEKQSFFVGIRSTFYRISMIAGQGLLVIFAGYMEESTQNIPLAWSLTFYLCAGLFVAFAVYHFFVLPKPENDKPVQKEDTLTDGFLSTFDSFFSKKKIGLAIGFILLYRLGEAQLVKMASPFLLDPRDIGGLGLSTTQVGIAYGTVGVISLTAGGILGGILASRGGLKKWLWPMVFSMNLTNLAYVYMALFQPQNYIVICSMVGFEQFGYGFGFTAFMLYLIYISQGEHQTSHYAICTGFMALGMMLPGMAAGWIQEFIGYSNFFIWVCLCTIPGFILAYYLKIDPKFGKKR